MNGAAALPDAEERLAVRTGYALAPGVMLAGVAGGIAFPILPLVGLRAGLPMALIGAILAANRFGRVVASPLVGALANRIGGRRTLIVGLLIQIVVMLLYVLGVSAGRPGLFFLLGRLLHGPGSACVFVSAQALALQAGGTAHGGRVAGMVRAAMGTGVPLGLVAGGVLWTWSASPPPSARPWSRSSPPRSPRPRWCRTSGPPCAPAAASTTPCGRSPTAASPPSACSTSRSRSRRRAWS